MRPKTFKSKTNIPVVGLLVLAGVFFNTSHALAQAQGNCTLPAGMTAPPAGPAVTAQQVENGSASQMEFALAARDRYWVLQSEATDFAGLLYLQCLIRQEESAWRSGSTYLVYLLPDGRVFQHAKNMALSDRRLNPVIYGAILQALGINPVDLTDPAAARAAFTAAAAGNGGYFNVPGASGYAVMFAPHVIWLAGFDLGEAHLIPIGDEDIDYGNPSVTAKDVVDRESLKAFVIEAENHVTSLLAANDYSTVRLAFRDENGPWRHGPVYLYILDTTSNLILFHAAFPDRFELQPLVPTVRDAVTGEFLLTQVIEAAESSPEGGFVEYYFDDPTDDTDRADIPKVGYAREFTLAGLSERTQTFIIGSGFYRSAESVVAARQTADVKSLLPHVIRAMTTSTVDAVSSRVRQAQSDAPPATVVSLGGASTFTDVLMANGQALEVGNFNLNRLIGNSSFALQLNTRQDTGGSGPFGSFTLWGSGDYRDFSGGDSDALNYDGSVVSAHLGIDTRLGMDLLAGVSVARASGTVDYVDTRLTGESTTTLTSINPYLGWRAPGGLNFWATAGYGWGEVEIDYNQVDAQQTDLTQRMVAAGVNRTVAASDQLIEGGTTSLRIKAETAFTWSEIDGTGTFEAVDLYASRQRLMLEGGHAHIIGGATLTPSFELGMRNDGGDGDTGRSLEVGGGLRYAHLASGLIIEGRARTVPVHSGEYREWGVSGLLRFDPGAGGKGLALSLRPAWGHTASGVQRLWETGMAKGAVSAGPAAGRVNARIAYGIGAAQRDHGVLTPYTDLALYGEGTRRLSLGGQFRLGSSLSLSLEGVHSRPARGPTNHGVMLRSGLVW